MSGTLSNIQEISMEGFQVVSGDMFYQMQRTNTPTLTFWYNSISFGKAALVSLNTCERIRIEVNPARKCILLVPATAKDKDSVRWLKTGKYPQSRKIDCIQFTSKLYETWGWKKENCYRAIGRLVMADQKVMLLFDFSEPEYWEYKKKDKVQVLR